MTILSVHHVTKYRYRQPVLFGQHRVMFRPRDSYDQRLLSSSIDITPEPTNLRWIHDVFGNCVAIATFAGRADELCFETRITLDHTPSNAPHFEMEEHAKTYPFSYGADEMPDLTRSIERQYLDPDREVDRWARQFLRQGRKTETASLLMTMTNAIREGFSYERRVESGIREPKLTLKLRRGSCRDLAMLMIEAVRALGFPARFVSGYIYVPSRDEPGHLGGGSTHAWCQVYLPGAGWVEFDPTNGIIGNRDLIRVAVVRDPRQAIPVSGTWTGFPSDWIDMEVMVKVTSEGSEKRNSADEARPRERLRGLGV
ncbi:transglutaminase-like putative cysteine protease [Rhodoligotrophos appendicifer]|uniref:transglutaminase family protein n=1 Tax=Rhodoligotrophos appendicifer TaxID=987056 RepID=UPI001185148D|nr:transglutaminase family protein [Rhodoligotrophos appendicifer]